MTLATWKRMAPPDYSGILDAYAKFGEQLGEGITGIGDAATDYADKRSSRETANFVADLMQAGSQEERDAMINAANIAWLNIDEINATNYELGQPERDLAVAIAAEKRANETWQDRLKDTKESNIEQNLEEYANRLLYDQDYYRTITKPQDEAEAAANEAEAKAKERLKWKPVDDPLTLEDGYFQSIYGWNKGVGPFGPGFDEPDLDFIIKYRTAFIDTYGGPEYRKKGTNITSDDFNRFILAGEMNFVDKAGLGPWGGDQFTFAHDGNFAKNIEGNEADLHEKILEFKNKISFDKVNESWDFNEFRLNNVKSFGIDFDWENEDNLDLAHKVFAEIQADNTISADKKTSAISAERINEIRSTIVSRLETKLKDDLVSASDIKVNSKHTPFAERYIEDMSNKDIAELEKELLITYEATDGELPPLKLEVLRLILENASK